MRILFKTSQKTHIIIDLIGKYQQVKNVNTALI